MIVASITPPPPVGAPPPPTTPWLTISCCLFLLIIEHFVAPDCALDGLFITVVSIVGTLLSLKGFVVPIVVQCAPSSVGVGSSHGKIDLHVMLAVNSRFSIMSRRPMCATSTTQCYSTANELHKLTNALVISHQHLLCICQQRCVQQTSINTYVTLVAVCQHQLHGSNIDQMCYNSDT